MNNEEDKIIHWFEGEDCCNRDWEAAYNRFESREEERSKFRKRLRAMGVHTLPKGICVADLFCGRGSNLDVLGELGFQNVLGVDLSPSLLCQYKGPAKLFVGDCRDMKLADRSVDLVIVQGGLHHLPKLPEDLELCLSEINRILAPDSLVLFVEPALTLFLRIVHFCCGVKLLRKMYARLDALAVMIGHEKEGYFNWLHNLDSLRGIASERFDPLLDRTSFGKWYFLGRKR